MRLMLRYKKYIATFFLVVMTSELLIPATAFSLTSGPAQPEMQGFQPIGANDMVDLFTGDFSYNIPLMDVGGYPLNLSYQSGSSLDDEASWVGYGWSLNPGVINRQLRGIPDDFNGSDLMTREQSMKDQITKGAKLSYTLDLLGVPVAKINRKVKRNKKLNLIPPALSLAVKYDNYRGIGVDLGLNTGLNLTNDAADDKTTTTDNDITPALGAGLTLSSFDGASLGINFSISKKRTDALDRDLGMSLGFPYNSRTGLSQMTLGISTNSAIIHKKELRDISSEFSSTINFNDQPFYLPMDMPRSSEQYSFTLHAGPELFVAFPGVGVSGFYTKQKLATNKRVLPAYGSLYSEKGKSVTNAMMDFNREKDIPYSKEVNFLPIPVPMQDLFMVNSQAGSGQYRIYRGSAATFFDPQIKSSSISASLGIEGGGGTYFDIGSDLYFQNVTTKNEKWKKNNAFLGSNDFSAYNASLPLLEPAYFKRVGEPVPLDQTYYNQLIKSEPVAASQMGILPGDVEGARSENKFRTKSNPGGTVISGQVQRLKRDVRNTTFSYLTAEEANNHALNKAIRDYQPDLLSLNNCNPAAIKNSFSRVGSYRKKHHLSEITITDDEGKRMIYDIPVYNVLQEDVTFSIKGDLALRNKGLINYKKNIDDAVKKNANGIDNYISREVTPPYATGYLLGGILSPDYRDLTGNGITDDDHGDAVKFNYTRLDALYKWRTPYAYGADTANYNEGLLSDPNDDKASYSYGEKEVWYSHSIESKTMIAHFVLRDREDGFGVTDKHGAKNVSTPLKRLHEIRLYSKADVKLAGGNMLNVVPIKVVHFEYDYSLVTNLPNSINGGGKLTLKKVYFTFGANNKGSLHPYQFNYNTQFNHYDYRQYDRWGVFKNATDNPAGMNNAEFPYTIQERGSQTLTDSYVAAGQLQSINLPSGGTIQVTYESDDYAYVQNKRAAVMGTLVGAIDASTNTATSSGLIDADEILVQLPWPLVAEQIQQKCFEGIDKLYFKCFLDLDKLGHKEYVAGYAKILSFQPAGPDAEGSYNEVKIRLEKINNVNPIAAAGWQFLRTELPQYAYPGSQNLQDNGGDLKKIIKALASAAKNITELFNGFEKRALQKGYSNNFEPDKSWVRIGVPEKKQGGGARVKKIEISDNWASISGTPQAVSSSLAQVYDYTTTDPFGDRISSGVASYEPMLGNDENPFRQPVPYVEKQFLGLNTYRYIEMPMGESFFPAPSVGYSKVTVRNIGSGDAEAENRTGVTVSEFYTAKDFPTKVDWVNMDKKKPVNNRILSLLGIQITDMVGLTQGYVMELNDMHGKPKASKVLNKSGDLISQVEYTYRTQNDKAESLQLKNEVKVMDALNKVTDGTIGMDVEVFHDMRQQTTENLGTTVKWSAGLGSFFYIPLPFGFPGVSPNFEKRSYRAITTVKMVHRFGILDKVKKTENGSSITTTNLLWDGLTGNVLLTSTQNEFDDPVYSFAYPAHWEYPGMGPAYTNIGTIFENFSTTAAGVISNTIFTNATFAGDELINLNTAARYWIVRSATSSTTTLSTRLIDEAGNTVVLTNARVKLVRSGRRNMSNTAIATLVSLRSPVVGDSVSITQLTRVLDAKGSLFSDDWSVPVSNSPNTTSVNSCFYRNCMEFFLFSSFVKQNIFFNSKNRANFFAISSNNFTAGSIMDAASTQGETTQYPLEYASCRQDFFPTEPKSPFLFPFSLNIRKINAQGNMYVSNNDLGVMGTCTFRLTNVNSAAFIRFANSATPFTFDQLKYYLGARLDEVSSTGGNCVFDFKVKKSVVGTTPVCDLKFGCSTSLPDTTLFRITFTCPPRNVTVACADPIGRVINPYVAGILGNWRMKQQYAFQADRVASKSNAADKTSTDIRRSGIYNQMTPFWRYNTTGGWVPFPSTENKWIASTEMTFYNTKGLELENKDALNRHSSARFGYLESMPVAVASNAQNREIGYDGFEDLGFNLDCGIVNCPIPDHFGMRNLINGANITLNNAVAHSGKSSLNISGYNMLTRSLATVDGSGNVIKNKTFLNDATGKYLLNSNELVKGFSPLPNKKYVISFWVKDANPSNPKVNLDLVVNGTTVFNNNYKVPVVERWKRVEAQFTTPGSGSLDIGFNISGLVQIDDIRIHPFDAQMKTYAYDPSSTRLMAEHDENNFASFYEYDDEGILVRVKKETEKGIMTIRETRSSMKKN